MLDKYLLGDSAWVLYPACYGSSTPVLYRRHISSLAISHRGASYNQLANLTCRVGELYIGSMDLDSKTYSIEDLSNMTGFDRRVIRSFIEQGLMRGPDKMGRYAQYSFKHLQRLLVIKYFKEQEGYSTGFIRSKLLTMNTDELEVYAGKVATDFDQSDKPKSSALDYINSLKSSDNIKIEKESLADEIRRQLRESRPKEVESKNALEHLCDELQRLTNKKSVRKASKAEQWYRISVTPDLELAVRGIDDKSDLSRLERAADYLREILLGNND